MTWNITNNCAFDVTIKSAAGTVFISFLFFGHERGADALPGINTHTHTPAARFGLVTTGGGRGGGEEN